MGASFGNHQPGQRNVELNVVPFIDLMSCLTAFLLVTAVWTNMAQIRSETPPDARAVGDDEWPRAAVLITEDGVMIGLSRLNQIDRVPRAGADHDWDAIEEVLRQTRGAAVLGPGNPHATSVQIAAEDRVPYQAIVDAMDRALAAGFPRVQLAVPDELPLSFAR